MPGTFSYAVATNTVTVTGGTEALPADFASFVVADRAGTGTSLLAAWAPNSNTKALTYQVRPVELLALQISFIVAVKTAEADYIFITGTDAWGAAQTESLDVSAGNGTYVSTKRFKTITNIDCSDNAAGGGTVWADGTVAVTQPIWGVIWDHNNGIYQLDCFWAIGDAGGTTTWFTESSKVVIFADGVNTANNQNRVYIYNYATVTWGTLIDATTKATKDGCTLVFKESHYYGTHVRLLASGVHYVYSTSIIGPGIAGRGYFNMSRIWNSISCGCILVTGGVLGISHYYGVAGAGNWGGAIQNVYDTTSEFIKVSGQSYPIDCSAYFPLLFKNIIACNQVTGEVYSYDTRSGKNRWIIDCDLGRDDWRIFHNTSLSGGMIYRQYTLLLKVTDAAGNSISNATVTLTAAGSSQVFSTTTDENGDVIFSGEDSSTVPNTVTHTIYYYSGSAQVEYQGPWTLTITKTGYQDYQDVITIDRKMDLEVAMSAGGGGSVFIRKR